MGLDSSYVFEPEQGLFQIGMDSLMALELKTTLEGKLGYTLPPTIAFEYPTIEALAGYLANKVLRLDASEPPAEEVVDDQEQVRLEEAIAELEDSSEDDLVSLLADELLKIDERRSR
jgi:acyl carrier protein